MTPAVVRLIGGAALRRCAAVDGLPWRAKHRRRLPPLVFDLETRRYHWRGRVAGFDQ